MCYRLAELQNFYTVSADSVVVQGQDVYHYITIRLDASLFADIVLLDGGFGCRPGFRQEVFNRTIEARTADDSSILFIRKLLRRLKVGNCLDRPNEPQLFRPFFLIKPKPAL